MAEIELRNVDKHFGALHVIRDVNLTVTDKEFVVFLGPSGCGKTTTLRAIAGLEDIDSGDILIDGKPVQNVHASERDIAFVFQNYALYPHLTVYENMAFPLRAVRQSQAEVDTHGALGRDLAGHRQAAQAPPVAAFGRRHAARRHRPCAGPPAQGAFCSTNRSARSMPSCAKACASNSSACISRTARPRST